MSHPTATKDSQATAVDFQIDEPSSAHTYMYKSITGVFYMYAYCQNLDRIVG